MQLVVPCHKDTKLNVPQLFGKGHRKHRTCILCGPGGTWRQSLRSELLPVRHRNESNFCFEEQTGRCCGQTRTVFKIRAKSFRLSSVKVRQVLCAFGLWRNWRRTKICSHWRPIRGRIRTKTTTINHTNIFIHILGVCLCISGWIGRLWLSRYHFSSAALFRVLEHRLIVLIYIFSYNSMPIKLKLSHA